MEPLHQSHKNCLLLLFLILSPYFDYKVAIKCQHRNFHNSRSLMKIGWLLFGNGRCLLSMMMMVTFDKSEFIELAFYGNYNNSFSQRHPYRTWYTPSIIKKTCWLPHKREKPVWWDSCYNFYYWIGARIIPKFLFLHPWNKNIVSPFIYY